MKAHGQCINNSLEQSEEKYGREKLIELWKYSP